MCLFSLKDFSGWHYMTVLFGAQKLHDADLCHSHFKTTVTQTKNVQILIQSLNTRLNI